MLLGAELVPVLVEENKSRDGEITVVESNRILEFLDDFSPPWLLYSLRVRLSIPNRITG